MDVRLNDGTIVQNVPDGITQTELMARVGKMRAAPVDSSPTGTDARIAQEAMYKGLAGLPDMLLNAPNNVLNLLKAGAGRVAGAVGRPDLMPELTPNPDLARRGMESAGLINPNIQPQGMTQRAIDTLTQGAVGGALTGGASLLRTAVGAGMGALSSGAAGATQAATDNPALAATAGMLAPVAAGRVMSATPTVTPQARLLADEGVSLTPGQIRGGAVKRVEDAMTSIPVVGDVVRGAQRRGIETFDAAAINRSLEPIGGRLPNGLRGNAAIEYARQHLGDAYENLLPNLRGDLNAAPGAGTLPAQAGQPAPPSFRQELATIRQMGQNLPEPQRGQLGRILDREIIDRFTPQGLASGETLKDIESKLGNINRTLRRSDDYDVRTLGGAVQEAQAAMRRMVENVNPQAQGELQRINEGYANFKKVQAAAARIGAQEGVFSPAHLQSAVRAGDTSKDKRAFSEGNALMQDLSAAGKTVLPSSVPDSGTPFRSMVAAAMTHPVKAAALGIPLALGTLPYTRFGGPLTQMLLMRQGNPMYGEVANQTAPITTGMTLADLLRQHQ